MSQKGIFFLRSHISLHLHSTQPGFAQPQHCPAVTPHLRRVCLQNRIELCSRYPEPPNNVGKASIRTCNPQLLRPYFSWQEMLPENTVPSKTKASPNRRSNISSTVHRRCISAREIICAKAHSLSLRLVGSVWPCPCSAATTTSLHPNYFPGGGQVLTRFPSS